MLTKPIDVSEIFIEPSKVLVQFFVGIQSFSKKLFAFSLLSSSYLYFSYHGYY